MPALDHSDFTACPNPLPIDLILVTLANGETVYASCQEAGALKWATLLDTALSSVADTIAATRPERLMVWAGIGLLFLVAVLSSSNHKQRTG